MRVILFRHGPAGSRDVARWPDDALRPLTPRGERRTRLAALGLRKLVGPSPRVVTSPLLRAAQTAKIAAEVLGGPRSETLEALAPGGGAREVLAFLRRMEGNRDVILVGHEPDLGAFAGALLSDPPVALLLKKAGACSVRFEAAPDRGKGVLEWFAPPRLLRRLAGRKVHP